MRLEFEPTVTAIPLIATETLDEPSSPESADAKILVKRGIKAAQNGERDRAHFLLSEAADADPSNEDAWVWLASLSEYPEEQIALLERVLTLNPANRTAREWHSGAKGVLAKTFVRRAVEAHETGDASLAERNLDIALSHDDRCEIAWTWKASLAADADDKLAYLDTVLAINPKNHDAASAKNAIEHARTTAGFNRAKMAAAGGDRDQAILLVDEFLLAVPDNAEAWILRSHLSAGLEEKLELLAKALTIDPDNAAARTGYDFLAMTLGTNSLSSYLQPESEADPLHTTAEPVAAAETASPMSGEVSSELEDAIALTTFSKVEPEPDAEPHANDVETLTLNLVDEAALGADTAILATVDHPCPFCRADNDVQAVECSACRATLTLADIGRLLGNTKVETAPVQQAITEMEAEWNLRDFNEDELTSLALGHLNLGNHENGLRYLQEAARINPDDLILTAQTNAVAIRLEEMRPQNEIHESMPRGKTILVVDDSATVRKLIAGKLEKSGHNVICASDGVEALACLEENLPDLVLLDINMPRMDGYEVCREIRSNPAAQNLPVVMISGKDGFFDKVRGRTAGTTGHVTKPFGPETLMKALETYLVPTR
ncbi:MAG: response regulator [Pyrinomonadaceae bacterium]